MNDPVTEEYSVDLEGGPAVTEQHPAAVFVKAESPEAGEPPEEVSGGGDISYDAGDFSCGPDVFDNDSDGVEISCTAESVSRGTAGRLLVSDETARALDEEASVRWGFNPFALVETAGRALATALVKACPFEGREHSRLSILALAGSGNNGADALVVLRTLVMCGFAGDGSSAVLSREPKPGENNPHAAAVTALRAMGIPVTVWKGSLPPADLVLDGIAGTGLSGPLRGVPLEMARAAEGLEVVSIDLPSPRIHALATLAVEPLKQNLYNPSVRPFCGTIIPVGGIFPSGLLSNYGGEVSPPAQARRGLALPPSAGQLFPAFRPAAPRLLSWKDAALLVPPVPPDAYKYRRGLAELHAGSPGFAGAARLAAEGAQAAGAGLVRLVLDDSLYPLLAPACGGIMASPRSGERGRFKPDAVLLGPGWGQDETRRPVMEQALKDERRGIPLILDADGIALAKAYFASAGVELRFGGLTILTPHAGELEALSGIEKGKLLSRPAQLSELAAAYNAVILFKSHVMIIARPAGPLLYVDGMNPALAAGGSGDLLAGFCAALAARFSVHRREHGEKTGADDLAAAAAAAASLLAAAASSRGNAFGDPLDLVPRAARLAGAAWLPRGFGGSGA
jgi:NAD(P)H-hydrate epimerase